MKEIATLEKPCLPAVVHNPSDALMSIISRAATDPTFDVAKLEKLLDVKERWEREEARKAFDSALSDFKSSPPEILKDKAVSFGTTSYKHATLGNVSEIIGSALGKHGLSHRWDVEQKDGRIKVACILSHRSGHSVRVSLEAGPDTSGSKNPIQAIASAISYLERYTLLAVTGMATNDEDDDGRQGAAEGKPPIQPAKRRDETHTIATADVLTFIPASVDFRQGGGEEDPKNKGKLAGDKSFIKPWSKWGIKHPECSPRERG